VDGLTPERAAELLGDRRAAPPRPGRGVKKAGAARKATGAKKAYKNDRITFTQVPILNDAAVIQDRHLDQWMPCLQSPSHSTPPRSPPVALRGDP